MTLFFFLIPGIFLSHLHPLREYQEWKASGDTFCPSTVSAAERKPCIPPFQGRETEDCATYSDMVRVKEVST